MNITEWQNCYDQNWNNLIVSGAIGHPAKFAHGLIRRIYQHALQQKWIEPGDTVLDPFGGVALGSLYAQKYGLHWLGVELEQKFVDLGQANIALWETRLRAHFPNWGSAILLQGDSRYLAGVLGQVESIVSSPPYINTLKPEPEEQTRLKQERIARSKTLYDGRNTETPSPGKAALGGGYGISPGQLSAMAQGNLDAVLSSPPFAGNSGGRGEASRNGIDAALFDRHSGGMIGGMGESDDNLGNLPMRDFNAVIGSPPFAESVGSDDPDKRGGLYRDPKRRGDKSLTGTYGNSEGQLGAMRIDGMVSSPPYEKAQTGGAKIYDQAEQRHGRRFTEHSRRNGYLADSQGQTGGQLGNESKETFWQAARQIAEQCYFILKPGGVTIWVVKDFVRNGQRVPFCDQWRQLCEAVGFEHIESIRAMQIKRNGSQMTLEGDLIESVTERKSFFRRLAEKKGSPKIDWEMVICLRKP